jgi:hypothetical protein
MAILDLGKKNSIFDKILEPTWTGSILGAYSQHSLFVSHEWV